MLYKKIHIIISHETQKEQITALQRILLEHYRVQPTFLDIDDPLKPEPDLLCFLYLSDKLLKEFFKTHQNTPLCIAILPNAASQEMMQRYGVSKVLEEAIADGLNADLRSNEEFLLCNGEIVFKKVSIGNVQNLSKNISESSLWSVLGTFYSGLQSLQYKKIELKTAKEQTISTVASGVLVLEDYINFNMLKRKDEDSFHDGKLNAFIVAPASIISYIYYLVSIFLQHRFAWNIHSNNIGFISSQKLTIMSPKPFDFMLDQVVLSTKELELKIVQSSFSIHFGSVFLPYLQNKATLVRDDKETIKIKNLPKEEMQTLLIAGDIPLFQKASDEEMKSTLMEMKKSSMTDSIFIVLMILSSLLATIGLFQNSIPSVIGAMILAPLMAPIIALAMGLVRNDTKITQKSIYTLATGILSALFFSALLTLLMPLSSVTDQIASRLNPNVLDLLVAIVSGIAGGYASAKKEVAKSLAGVAIAVALVPPLSVTGIGIGWGDLEIIYGSFLLFLTNLFGVTLAAALTFIVLGFAPIKKAKRGVVFSSVALLVVSIPLFLSFYSLMQQNRDLTKLQTLSTMQISGKSITINFLSVHSSTSKSVTINAEVISSTLLQNGQYVKIKEAFEKRLEKKVRLEVIPTLVIE